MKLFSRKPLIGRAVAAGAILAAGAAMPALAADDLPVVDEIELPSVEFEPPPPPPVGRYYDRPYSQRYERGSYVAIPSARRERSVLGERPVLPPSQVVTILRQTGYSPLGQVTQRGWVYTIAALDPRGDDGRLIIDARTGRIMRFIPAMAVDERLNERMAAVYGPPGPPAIDARAEMRRGSLLDMRHPPRPQVAVPRAAQRAAPKVASRAPVPVARPAAAPAAQQAAPQVTEQPAQPAAQTPQIADSTTATAAGATIGQAAAPAAEAATPATVELLPTQAMPDVQPLE